MKKLLMMLAFVAGFGLLANAQTKTPLTDQQKADRATKTLQKQLNLTADQATKVNAIYTSRAVQLDSVKMHPGVKGNGKKKKTIAEDTQAKINAVLTPAQQQQFAQWKDMKKQKMQANRKMKKDSTATKM
ncbi:hypothetical protein [Mucilaginibacter sp.]